MKGRPINSQIGKKTTKDRLLGAASIAVIGLIVLFGLYGFPKYQARRFAVAVEAERQLGNWDRVAVLSLIRLDQSPRDKIALRYAADASLARGSVEQAIEFYGRLPTDDPDSAPGLLQLGILNLEVIDRPLQGEASLQKSLALDPTLMRACRELLMYYGKTFQSAKATALARASIVAGHEPPIAYVYLFSFEELISSQGAETCARWLTGVPRADAENQERLEVALTLHRSKAITNSAATEELKATSLRLQELEAQQQNLRDMLKKYPNHFELIAALLKSATDRGNQGEVAKLLSMTPASAVNDHRAWRYKGWLHRARDEFIEAEEALQMAIVRNPYDWRSRSLLGEVLRIQARNDEAQTQLSIADAGKKLETLLVDLDGIDVIPPVVLEQMRVNAEKVGDSSVASQLAKRLADLKREMEAASQ